MEEVLLLKAWSFSFIAKLDYLGNLNNNKIYAHIWFEILQFCSFTVLSPYLVCKDALFPMKNLSGTVQTCYVASYKF